MYCDATPARPIVTRCQRYQQTSKQMANWWQVVSGIFAPKVIKIWFSSYSQQCRGCFFWDTV